MIVLVIKLWLVGVLHTKRGKSCKNMLGFRLINAR